ncbi:nuclease-related domain-containing DEAD/DEAH box helicase [Azohydromonas aeria]|uniref:nuclease-related domain-containing DEAD/DEAH box helicase n=1 Tax=Azohydromonas aeria TaxID=2590212 RepID=UPI0012FB2B15|nr:ATP-binding domain-containing protein [Azohydromonas aeria]
MVQVHPPLESIRPLSPGEHAEFQVLQTLARGLPQAYALFHGVNWAEARPGADLHGEIDIVVVNDAGDVALLEVKAGTVSMDEQGIFKRYGASTKDVTRQARTQFDAVLHRLRSEGLGSGRLLHLLVLPDQRVEGPGTIAFPRDRILDAADCVDLCGCLQRTLGAGRPDAAVKASVCDFFADRLGLEPDVSILAGALRERVTRIAGGLADWVPRIESPSGVIRVQATAGSGKTQLAMRLLRRARAASRAAAYVCFNRPLADHMRDIAPAGSRVATFHQLCWEAAGSPLGAQQDYAAQARQFVEAGAVAEPAWDVLVIDELQDLQPDWVQALLDRLRDGASAVLLEDPAQCLYTDRQEMDITQAVVVRSQENYRSPRRVVEAINLLRLAPEPVLACGPYQGEHLEPAIYQADGGGSLVRETARAVQRCLDKGFALDAITVLCWRGRDNSALLALERLGNWRLACFSGAYDERGRPVWSDGELRIETVRRFKGQSADAVVLTEVDFDELGSLQRRLLFVALTRARMHVEIVMTATTEGALMAQAKGAG